MSLIRSKKMKKNYFKRTIMEYLNSFTNLKLLLSVFVLDLLFVLFAYLGFFLVVSLFKGPMDILGSMDMSDIGTKSLAEIRLISTTLRNMFLFLIAGVIILFLFIVLDYSLFEGMAWCRILKKRFNMKYFWKFTLLNLIWFIIFLVLILIFSMGSKGGSVSVLLSILAFAFMYFTLILSYLFTEKNRFGQIKRALKLGTVKIRYLLLPLILIFITSFLVGGLGLVFKNLVVFFVVNIIFALLLFSWIKIYISEAIGKVKV